MRSVLWALSRGKFSRKLDVSPEFISHLEELRKRLIISLVAFAAISIGAYFFSHQIIDFLIVPLERAGNPRLYFHKPYEAFMVHIGAAALAGFVLSAPVYLTQLWIFVAPALYQHEKKIFMGVLAGSLVLFSLGAVFAYYVMVPWGIAFLMEFRTDRLEPLIGAGPYFSFLSGMVMSFAVLFDLPLLVIGLTKMGVTSSKTLATSRKIILILILITAAVLTPSPDPVSQLCLAIPLYLLFEVSLLVSAVVEKK